MEEETTLLKVVYRAENMRVVEEQGAKIIPLHVGVGAVGYGIGKGVGKLFPAKGLPKNATADIIGMRGGKRVLTQHNSYDYDVFYNVDAGGRVGNYLGMVEHGNWGSIGKGLMGAAGAFGGTVGYHLWGSPGNGTNEEYGNKGKVDWIYNVDVSEMFPELQDVVSPYPIKEYQLNPDSSIDYFERGNNTSYDSVFPNPRNPKFGPDSFYRIFKRPRY